MAKKASTKKAEAKAPEATNKPTVEEMVKQPLWKLNEHMLSLISRIEAHAEEHDGEIPDDLNEEWEALGEALPQKIDNCIVAVKGFGWNISKIKAEEDRIRAEFLEPLRELRKAHEGGLERLKKYLATQIEKAGEKRVDATFGRMRVQNTAGSVEITNPAEVPDKFKTVVLEMPRQDFIGLKRLIRAHRGDDQLEWLTQFVTDEKISKAEIKTALGDPEYIDGMPGVEFIKGKALILF